MIYHLSLVLMMLTCRERGSFQNAEDLQFVQHSTSNDMEQAIMKQSFLIH